MKLIAVKSGSVRREVDGMLRLGYPPEFIGRISGQVVDYLTGRWMWVGSVYVGPAPEFYRDGIEVDVDAVMGDLRITRYNDWQVRH